MMQSKQQILTILALGALSINLMMQSCFSGSGFGDVPEISFVSLSKDTMNQGSLLTDSLVLSFSFRDGNGDIGTSADFGRNIILTDSRTGSTLSQFKTPSLPESGASGGIEGIIRLKLFNECCVFPEQDSIPPCSVTTRFPSNMFTVDIQIMDDAGNESNVVTSAPITLLCN